MKKPSSTTSKIGIMTYHAAYNFGSVLQAYATQTLLDELGYANEIINYRLPNQRDYYGAFFAAKFGVRDSIRRLICLREFGDRRVRKAKFENFIAKRLRLRKGEISNFQALKEANLDYDILLSGSDQVWNIHCVAEFQTEPPESIRGYFLDFGRADAQRLAFSSSIGSMRREEIAYYKELLDRFQTISVREKASAELLSDLLGKRVYNTVDPTLTLTKETWQKLAARQKKYNFEHYLFVYSLHKGTRSFLRFLKTIKKYADSKGLKVVCVSPFLAVPYPGVYLDNSCGPEEFLAYIEKAALVVTNTFHGTAFSVNLERPFYSINEGADTRKIQLLSKVQLINRSLTQVTQLNDIVDYSCSFDKAHELLDEERALARAYLRMALGE